MKKYLILLFLSICSLCYSCASADTVVYQDLIDEITNNRAESIYDINLNAPFEKEKSGIREEIDIETGNMNVSYDFFTFPAHGGQSISFGAVYNVNLAKEFDESITDTGDANANVEKTAYESSLYSLGIGWKLPLPGIELETIRNKTRVYVHLTNGAVYIANTNTETGLDDYELSDLVFSSAVTTLDGESYPYNLRYKDGTQYYFGSDGLCRAKTDRFMNTVMYTWEEYDTGKFRVSSVSDSCGRTIIVEYTERTVNVRYGNMCCVIERSITDNGGYVIDSVTDPAGRKTCFEYYSAVITYNFCPGEYVSNTNIITAMNKITYPTGLCTLYEYTAGTKWLYEDKSGTIEYLKIKKRYDIEDNKHTNLLEYSYVKEPCGYPDYKSSSIPDSYEYHIAETDSFGTRTTYTHDGRHNPVRTSGTSDGYKIQERVVSFDTLYNLPVTISDRQYSKDGTYRETITEMTYDSRGNMLSTDTYQKGDKGKHRIDYAYSGSYDICTYEGYKQDDSVKVETLRTLDGQSRFVVSESVLRNGSIVKKDEYTYNSFGDMLTSRVQTDTDIYLTTGYVYRDNLPYPSEVIQKDIADADGICTSISTYYDYDSLGNVTVLTLPNGSKRQYTYDGIGRVTSETLEDGSKRLTEYDDKKNILTTTDTSGTKLIYEYDTTGALVRVTDSVTGTIHTHREYDFKKRLVTEKDAKGAIAQSTYDSKDRLTAYKVTDKDGKLYSYTRLEYDDAQNTVTTTEGDIHKSVKNIYTYDMFNRLTEQTLITDTEAYTTSHTYDYVGNNISFTDESGNITQYEYDIFGNPTKLISPMGNTEEYTYDFLGNVTQYINGAGDKTEYVYDALGRLLITRKYFDGSISEYRTLYDSMGNVIKTTDENGNETSYEYNERNLLTSSGAYAETGKGIKTEYSYDSEGRLLTTSYGSLQNPNERNITRNSYDLMGNLTKRVDNSGKISYYEYDGAGQLIRATDPKGIVTRYEYDVLGRQIRISNGINPDIIYAYNLIGELESITEGDKTVTYVYDERGYLTRSCTGSTTDTYTYDKRGNVLEHITMDITAGEIRNTYTYDKDNRTTSVITPLGIQSLSYDGAGRLIGSENSNTGSIRQIVYDQRGLPVSATTKLGDKILSAESNVYDLIGNKVRSMENGYVREYRYDGLNRLVSVSEDNKDTLYEFDAYGNIAKEHEISDNILNTKLYCYDADNRLILSEKNGNVTSYEYDANGNMTRQYSRYSDIYYEYDGRNRLTEIIKPTETIRYEYNAEGFRDSKYTKDGVTRFLYDNGNVSAEILPDGNVYKYYRADGIIGSVDSTGNRMYYSQNTHGDVTSIYDITGKILKDYRYNAYGKTQTLKPEGINSPYLIQWFAETNNVHNPFGYCGEYTDNETGLIYLRNRYYDPSIGRFITEDPARDGLNWYAYCGGNPVMFVDPWGLYMTPRNTASKDILIQQIIKATGDYGYSYDEKNNRIIYQEGQRIEGGSEVARNLIKYIVTNDNFTIRITFKEKLTSSGSINDATSSGYTNGDIHIGSIMDDENTTSAFIHELTHAYTNKTNLDNSILFSFADPNDPYKENIKYNIKRLYQEATAITVEEQFRKDMGYKSRNEVTNLMIGINNYGQFPHIATSHPEQIAKFKISDSQEVSVKLKGRVFATTLFSHGVGIIDHINNSN